MLQKVLDLLLHGMLVVLVVNLEVGVSLLTAPVRHDVEWTGVGPGLRNDLVFQNINIEIGSLEVMQSSGYII